MTCRIVGCVATRADDSEYCAVHRFYREAGADISCAKCRKKIRSGSIAKIGANGAFEHVTCPTGSAFAPPAT